MKKILMSLMLLSAIAITPQTKAFVGIASNDDTTVLLGLVFMDLSSITVYDTHRTTHTRVDRRGRVIRRHNYFYTTYRILVYPAMLVAGIFLLDEDGNATISDKISNEVAQKSGLSSVERSAIEQHSEEITMIKDTIVSETSTIQDREERMKASGELWTEYGQFLPEAAMSGLYKMVTTL